MEDNQIISLYLARDEQAVQETADKYGKSCYNLAYRVLSDVSDSEECVNDTYLTAWNTIPPTIPNILSAYLYKITRRLAVNVLRHRTAKKRGGDEADICLEELAECVSGGKTAADEAEQKLLSKVMNDFIKQLSPAKQAVFVRRYFYIQSVEKIAEDLGYSVSKVKSMLMRTRDKLKDWLKKEGF